MTEQEAKALASELEHNKYWRVESISAPYKMRNYVTDGHGSGLITGPLAEEEHVTVCIQHRIYPHRRWTISGAEQPASVAAMLLRDGPTQGPGPAIWEIER